tara:strand:+ start:721 stop:879 length:159 start_codon:yes stop_codon:yes gene_type:complete
MENTVIPFVKNSFDFSIQTENQVNIVTSKFTKVIKPNTPTPPDSPEKIIIIT